MPAAARRARLLGAICLVWACSRGEAPAPPAPEVLVVEAVARDVPVVSEWLGTTVTVPSDEHELARLLIDTTIRFPAPA